MGPHLVTQVLCELEEALVVVVPFQEQLLVVLGLLRFNFGLHGSWRSVGGYRMGAVPGWGAWYGSQTLFRIHHCRRLQPATACL